MRSLVVKGFNRHYATLRGRGNYRRSYDTNGNSLHTAMATTWARYKSWLSDAFRTLFGLSVDFTSIPGTDPMDVTWFARNKEYLDAVIKIGHYIYIMNDQQNSSGYRKVYNTLGAGVEPAVAGNYQVVSNAVSVLTPDASYYEFMGPKDKPLASRLIKEGYSAVLVSGLKHTSSERYAVYVNPIGVDVFHVSGYDTNLFDLEAVYMARGKQPKFKGVTPTYRPGYDFVELKAPDIWVSYIRPLTNTGSAERYDVYFRLRDKTTNEVSLLSQSYLHVLMRVRYTVSKWVVKPNPP